MLWPFDMIKEGKKCAATLAALWHHTPLIMCVRHSEVVTMDNIWPVLQLSFLWSQTDHLSVFVVVATSGAQTTVEAGRGFRRPQRRGRRTRALLRHPSDHHFRPPSQTRVTLGETRETSSRFFTRHRSAARRKNTCQRKWRRLLVMMAPLLARVSVPIMDTAQR